jgi:hypothetical protein
LNLADSIFQQNAGKLLAAQDIKGFEQLVKAQIQRMMPTAAKNINKKYATFSGGRSAERRAEAQSRVEGAAGGTVDAGVVRYAGPFKNGGPDPTLIDWAAMRAKTGSRKGAEDMMFNRQFMKKGDSKNIYTW